ncbi:MAG TPA: hypothetical protein VM222_05830, partial [Planctomycetota bacterium]|nr:hypothetical protein [Planctomycetota bacterium]
DVFDWHQSARAINLPDVVTPEGKPLPFALPPAPVLHPNAPSALLSNPKAQALREEGEALQVKARHLEAEKARLFRDKNATAEEWTVYGREVRKLAVQTATTAMITNGLAGSKAFDFSDMDAKPQKEPPVPGKETQ